MACPIGFKSNFNQLCRCPLPGHRKTLLYYELSSSWRSNRAFQECSYSLYRTGNSKVWSVAHTVGQGIVENLRVKKASDVSEAVGRARGPLSLQGSGRYKWSEPVVEESEKSAQCQRTGMTFKVQASKRFQNFVVQMVRKISIVKVQFWSGSGMKVTFFLFSYSLIFPMEGWQLSPRRKPEN